MLTDLEYVRSKQSRAGAGLLVDVWINDTQPPNRRRIRVPVTRSNVKTFYVRLPDGNPIKRKRKRDLC